jgi:hypothetical protein
VVTVPALDDADALARISAQLVRHKLRGRGGSGFEVACALSCGSAFRLARSCLLGC